MHSVTSPMDSRRKFLLLGLPTWTLVDGTFAVLSQLADKLPEGFKISSNLTLALTMGNAFPIVFGSLVLGCADFKHLRYIIYGILYIALITGICLSLFWDFTVELQPHVASSFPLYVMFFVAGACATLSNVTHFTFVSHWPAANTTWMATGFGLGSMTAGILSLLQGTVLKNMGFSVRIYYLVLSTFFVPAIVMLGFLNSNPQADAAGISEKWRPEGWRAVPTSSTSDLLEGGGGVKERLEDSEDLLQWNIEPVTPRTATHRRALDVLFIKENLSILSLQLVNAFLGFGAIPSIISYLCGKFHNASLILLLTTCLSAIIDPSFRAATSWIQISSRRGLQLLSLSIWTLSAIMFSLLALPSSSPFFQGAGGGLVVILYGTVNALHVFTNTSIFLHFKLTIHEDHMQQSYRLGGIATQIGAVMGTLVVFTMFNSGVFG